MECTSDGPSDIVGVALDGFPIYGPMQWWSEKERKAYINKDNCSDCVLAQLDGTMTDKCGGVEMADGDPTIGTVYRYIGKGEFPYIFQWFIYIFVLQLDLIVYYVKFTWLTVNV